MQISSQQGGLVCWGFCFCTACQSTGGFNLGFCIPEQFSLPRHHPKGSSLRSLPIQSIPCWCFLTLKSPFSCKSTQLHRNSVFQMETVGNGLEWLILACGDSEFQVPKFCEGQSVAGNWLWLRCSSQGSCRGESSPVKPLVFSCFMTIGT